MIQTVRMVSTSGILGYGFPEASIAKAMKHEPHMIGVDGGSSDPGPYYLGSGKTLNSEIAMKRDLRLMLLAARQANIPMMIGTCGGAGGRPHVEATVRLIKEIAREEGLHFKLAVIHSELERPTLHHALTEGRIQPLGTSAPLTPADIDEAHRVVGMMGPEPYLEALQQGAQVILGGRGTDPSPWVALAKHLGMPDHTSWYAGKLLECACNAALPKKHDCLVATVTPDYVEVEPANEELACSPLSVSIQALHETASPIYRHEPGGIVDTSHCKMEAIDGRRVRISGMEWQPQPYTIKLEGVRSVGFSCITVAATRDPGLIGQLDSFLLNAEAAAHTKIQALGISQSSYRLVYRAYGRDGVMGALEPLRGATAHEICIVAEVVADTQEIANAALALARVTLLHMDFPGRLCREGNMAFPFSPSDLVRGQVFEFSMNHVIKPASPLELFPIEYEDV